MKFNVEMMQSSRENYKLGNSFKIFLDGNLVKNCIEFDTEVGYVDYYPEKSPFSMGGLITHRVFGKVEVYVPYNGNKN